MSKNLSLALVNATYLLFWLQLSLPLHAEQLFVAPDIYAPASRQSQPPEHTANELYQRARQKCEAGELGAALRLATAAVAADPDHADARRVLGYRRVGAHWAGSYAARRIERGETWHSEFGWIQAEDLARYEAGERPFGKRWISAEDDAKRHATIDDGWRVRTDHFRVTTNHSPQEATRLAAQLEALHQVWLQLFGEFALKPTDLLKRFDGKESSGYRSKPFEVVYHRNRDEYNAALLRQQPRIAMTLGIYFDKTHTTHFFAGDEQDAGTIYHEAVHQFFQESRPAARSVGAKCNAWMIEGVACYFESLTPQADKKGSRTFAIGRAGDGRLPAARHRRLVDDYYVPLTELSALGIQDFQNRSDLPRLYSQSAGLATFLMHYERGKYRSALVKTMQLLYAGRDKVSTLEDLTGHTFAELDVEYRQYLETLSPSAETVTPASVTP